MKKFIIIILCFNTLLLSAIAAGIWYVALHTHNVRIVNTVDTYVSNTVEIEGEVEVDGGFVDVNIEEVLGYPIGCHHSYTIDGKKYNAIDVYKSNW